MAQARPAQAEEEGLRVLQGQGPGHRLQGHRPAAEVHLRPRQDPRPPGHRQLQSSTSATSRSRSRTPARWRCCPTPRPRAERRPTHEAHPHRTRCPTSARPATSSRSRTATAATTCCRAGWRSSPPGAPRSRSRRSSGPARPGEIRDLDHAKEVAGELGELTVTVKAKAAGDSRPAVRLGHGGRHRRRRRAPPAARRSTAAPSSCPARSRRSARTRSRCGCTRRSPPRWTIAVVAG